MLVTCPGRVHEKIFTVEKGLRVVNDHRLIAATWWAFETKSCEIFVVPAAAKVVPIIGQAPNIFSAINQNYYSSNIVSGSHRRYHSIRTYIRGGHQPDKRNAAHCKTLKAIVIRNHFQTEPITSSSGGDLFSEKTIDMGGALRSNEQCNSPDHRPIPTSPLMDASRRCTVHTLGEAPCA